MHDARTKVEIAFVDLLAVLIIEKPNDRSEADRAYAIVKTELEKAYAYYEIYCSKRFDW